MRLSKEILLSIRADVDNSGYDDCEVAVQARVSSVQFSNFLRDKKGVSTKFLLRLAYVLRQPWWKYLPDEVLPFSEEERKSLQQDLPPPNITDTLEAPVIILERTQSPQSVPTRYPADLEEVMPQLIEIMASEDQETKDSLKANIATFLRTIKYQKDLKEMNRRIEALEKTLGSGNPSGKPGRAGKGT